MRELTVFEMQNVAGSGFFDTIGGMFLGGAAGCLSTAMKWATIGGQAGGILGLSILTSAVYGVAGLVFGATFGAIDGMVNGYDYALERFNNVMDQLYDMGTPLPA
ncbi:hypothetical protein ACFSFZ_03215 [Mixta tenebrionis]|uniref:DUF5862 domain-containing protein n=1 Tax=Mixta tenebrionis TaxID=2562439 RepID=A0A506V5A0_9GAMM|nr:hypothetical protein [Mixta tenebrionis]TPW40716.1 hypothetical protein FKM52_17520 [Mixta tenebrionis]